MCTSDGVQVWQNARSLTAESDHVRRWWMTFWMCPAPQSSWCALLKPCCNYLGLACLNAVLTILQGSGECFLCMRHFMSVCCELSCAELLEHPGIP